MTDAHTEAASEASTSASASASTAPQPKVFLPPLAKSNAPPSTAGATLTPAPAPDTGSGSDSDLKPTTEELQALYASTVERNYRQGINPNAPLMTKAMREREEAKRRGGSGAAKKTYNEIRIRFRLPDQTQLEYTLPSSTPLLSLYPLLSSSFETSKPFTLYTSPPRTEYKEDDVKLSKSKLGDMGWGAAAIVQVRFHGEQAVLKEELKSQAKVLEPPSMGMSADQHQQQQEKSAPSGGRTLGGGTGNAEKKIPKWFKGFKK